MYTTSSASTTRRRRPGSFTLIFNAISDTFQEIFQQTASFSEFINRMALSQANILIDEIDGRILSELSLDSRRSYSDVGKDVGLSTAAVHERVRKMIERGVIERFSLQIDPEKVGLHLVAFVLIRNDGGVPCADVAPRLRAMPEVVELHSVAGEYDFMAKIRTTHARRLED